MATPMSDAAMLDFAQRQTLRYFTEFAHPVSGMARERSNAEGGYDEFETVCTGGTGFGVMALIAGVARGFLARQAVLDQVRRIVGFLGAMPTSHGAFPHFVAGSTGAPIEVFTHDDGGDLVETSFLMMGLLCAREFFASSARAEQALRAAIDRLWHAVEWDWYARKDRQVLHWHWSPRHGWKMDHAIRGWNECLITYVLAAASPTHPIESATYHRGWTDGPEFRNGHRYYDIELPLGPAYGGPLFFTHYSFRGLDPRGLCDRYADYFEQNRAHTLINHAHCRANPHGHRGYSDICWGLTASDGQSGYAAFSPTQDAGVIAPTAALSAFPYAPELSLPMLRYLLTQTDYPLWDRFGFVEAFNPGQDWVASGNLAINQGPIVVMIENYRSRLLWDLFMRNEDLRRGLRALDFRSPHLA